MLPYLDPRSSFYLPRLSARRLQNRSHLLHSLLLRQTCILTVTRALPANPVRLTFLTRTPREATVVLRSRVVPRTSLECHPVLYRTLSWRLCSPLRFLDRNGFPVIAIATTFAATTSSPGRHRISGRSASWRWMRTCCSTITLSRWSG
ncbi:hypothetical protein PPTG_07389 [Phytophthora nicotianae INRA-310]|uniref:Uncharacterized protein n=1 Tax=Phytophthora nicotianae (strain INRA-310) TaxID=761204 RepID=W2QQ38_PHYN3|nr:hypothetical protein PPTG_07389 [Phytophthora nicotianae INRA-310]ETN15228.1 hypothetical protein PPTG_07389 [Phytophthora nicotianae INRA-310]